MAEQDVLLTGKPEIKEEVAPSVDEKFNKLINKVHTHLEWAKNSTDRQSFEDRCKDAQNFWLAKQWDGIRSFNVPGRTAARKRLKPCPVDNYYKAQIEGLLGDVCDAPADIQIRPTEKGDEAIAVKMQNAVNHVWYVGNINRKVEYVTRRGLLYGPLIGKVFWDNDWVGGKVKPFVGEVGFTGISPTNFLIDPRIKSVEPDAIQQAGFLIYAVNRSHDYVYKKYPWVEKTLTSDMYATYVDTLTGDIEDAVIDPTELTTLVIEYWYKGGPIAPDYPAKVEGEEPFTDAKGEGVHVATVAGGVLLRHRTYACPVYPFAVDWLYPSDESAYGYGDGYDMLLPQLMINKLNEIAMEGHSAASIGNWIAQEGGIRNIAQFQKYASTGSSILPVTDVNAVRRDIGGQVPGSVFTHYGQEQRAMETVSGRLDISQGRAPRGVRAASAISLLLQQAAGRVRQRSRALAGFEKQIVSLQIMYIGHCYDDERLLRVVGADGMVEWDTFNRSDIVRVMKYTDPETGQQREEEYIPDLDINISVGAETPTSKAYYAEQALQLFQMQVIDDVALLDVLDFPKWRQIHDRMVKVREEQQQAQMQQQQAQQQAQAQAQQQGGGGMAGQGQLPVDPEAFAKLVQAIASGQIPIEKIPPELLMLIYQAVQSGQLDISKFPEEIQAKLAQAFQQLEQGGGGGGAPAGGEMAQLGNMVNSMQG